MYKNETILLCIHGSLTPKIAESLARLYFLRKFVFLLLRIFVYYDIILIGLFFCLEDYYYASNDWQIKNSYYISRNSGC